jgi:hypothetical protein
MADGVLSGVLSDIVFCSKVCTALLIKDYCSFFRLYSQAPYMSGYVIDFFVDRVRYEYVVRFVFCGAFCFSTVSGTHTDGRTHR